MNPTDGVISEAWEAFKAHWRHLVPIALVVYLAVGLISIVLVALLTWVGAILSFVIGLIALFWVQGALVRAVEDIRDGRADLSLGQTYERVRPQLPAIIVGGLLAGLGIALGLVLLIVPGLILLTWWIVIIPVIVLEERSAGEAFGRSRELVRGHGWNVFGVIVLTIAARARLPDRAQPVVDTGERLAPQLHLEPGQRYGGDTVHRARVDDAVLPASGGQRSSGRSSCAARLIHAAEKSVELRCLSIGRSHR